MPNEFITGLSYIVNKIYLNFSLYIQLSNYKEVLLSSIFQTNAKRWFALFLCGSEKFEQTASFTLLQVLCKLILCEECVVKSSQLSIRF